MIDPLSILVFLALFVIFVFLGFYGARWRKGDLTKLKEWGLAGGRLGTFRGWFLL
jgi:SSS family solute:Na+ symporter